MYFSFFISVDEKLKKWWQQWQRAHHLRIVAHCPCYHNFKLHVFFFLHFQSRWWKTQNWWQQRRTSTSFKNYCSLPLLPQIQAVFFFLHFSWWKTQKWWQQWQRAHHLRIVAHCSCYHNFKLNVFFFLHFQSRWWKTQNWWQQCRKSTSLKNCCSLPLLSQIQARSKNNI